VTLLLILKAFSSGCTAMTGIEAVSNGVPAFQPPESRNAATTMLWMSGILGTLFVGVVLLFHAYGLVPDPSGNPTLLSQLAEQLAGRELVLLPGPGYHARGPRAHRQHQLCRFPAAGVDPGSRSLRAARLRLSR